MATQEILSKNLLNNTSQVAVDSNTATTKKLFDRNTSLRYITSGYNSATVTNITISFTAATVISHVLLQNHNLATFSIFYDGTTTNQLFSTTANAISNTYIGFSSVTVSSITLRATTTFPTSVEKYVGELVIAERRLVFERNPSFKGFTPELIPKQIVHNMPDGGVSVYWIRDKFQAKIGWQFITSGFKENLRDIFESHTAFYFLAKPTTTSWDGRAYECSWIGPFNFKPSTNEEQQGFGGDFLVRQTYGA